MGKKIRKLGKRVIIFEIFLFLIVIFSSVIFFYYGDMYYSKLALYYNNKKVLDKKNKELKVLNNSISQYMDINSDIDKVKKKYFERAKELENKVINGDVDKKIAYLTFDDGPYYNTYKVLDILDKYGVGATFFTTDANGEYCHDNKEYRCYQLYMEYIKHGHTIANHTFTHSIFKGLYNSSDSFIDAVVKQEELVKQMTNGYVTNIVRFPGGSDTANYFKVKNESIDKLKQRGYGWVDWSSQIGDGGYLPNSDVAWKNFTGSINENIEVVLLHDYHPITTSLLPNIIEYLESNGYILLPLFYESSMVNK